MSASSPADAIARAWQDSQRLAASERPYMRYLWWPEGDLPEEDCHLLTKARANWLSDQGAFGEPGRLAPRLYRLDVRDYGWDKRPQVWERLAQLDPYFHMPVRAVEEFEYVGYWPGGPGDDGKEYKAGPYKLRLKPGQQVAVPALWADPAVALKPGLAASMHDALRKDHLTEAPVLMGHWWLVQTARQVGLRNKDDKTGFYDWLGLKSRDDVFDLAGLNAKAIDLTKASARFAEYRAAIKVSGISQQNRAVVNLHEKFWITLDVFRQAGRGVVERNLRPGELDHQAEESVFHLPNELQGYALTDSSREGRLQPSAPPEIGGDKSALNVGNDPRVHNDLSCHRCHGVDRDGVKPLDDLVRKKFHAGKPQAVQLLDPDKRVNNELKSLYMRDIQRLIDMDRARYAFAVANLTRSARHPRGLTVAQLTRLYCDRGWNDYVENRKGAGPVTLRVAAAELGVTPARLTEALFKYNADRRGSDLVLSELLEPGGSLTRLDWLDSYGYAQVIARGLSIPELVTKVKAKP